MNESGHSHSQCYMLVAHAITNGGNIVRIHRFYVALFVIQAADVTNNDLINTDMYTDPLSPSYDLTRKRIAEEQRRVGPYHCSMYPLCLFQPFFTVKRIFILG